MNEEASNGCTEAIEVAGGELEDDLYWAEAEADMERYAQRFDWLLDLIAWTCRQEANPKLCVQAAYWPKELIQDGGDYDFYQDKILRWLAFKDPLFFDLARAQTADLVELVGEDLAPEDFAFIAKLLRSNPPSRRVGTGDNFGRDFLIIAFLREIAPDDLLDAGKRWRRKHSDTRLCDNLGKILNEHHMLENLPEAAPSTDAIRAIWLKRGEFPLGQIDGWIDD